VKAKVRQLRAQDVGIVKAARLAGCGVSVVQRLELQVAA
jgi:hypothetical protein